MSLTSGTLRRNNVAQVAASLGEGEILCPYCDGRGVNKAGHSFGHGNLYRKCHKCNGTGKYSKERWEQDQQEQEKIKLECKLNKLPAIEVYEHHGADVSVMTHLKGKHTEHCLCYAECVHFKPGEPDNCEIAQTNYQMCVKFNLVTPVFECPKYEQREA